MRKEAGKRERERLKEEKAKERELNQKRKEEEAKKKEAEMAARKRFRDVEEKKEKERKRMCKEQQKKLHAEKEEKNLKHRAVVSLPPNHRVLLINFFLLLLMALTMLMSTTIQDEKASKRKRYQDEEIKHQNPEKIKDREECPKEEQSQTKNASDVHEYSEALKKSRDIENVSLNFTTSSSTQQWIKCYLKLMFLFNSSLYLQFFIYLVGCKKFR